MFQLNIYNIIYQPFILDMLRACIFDNKKALILSKTFRTKRAFAIKFGNNKARSLVKVATETSAKSFEFWRFSSLYSFFDRIKLNPISMRNRIPQSMPYILEERKAPKGKYIIYK